MSKAPVLTREAVIDIRKRYLAGDRLKDLARDYGVRPSNVSDVINVKTWKHIPVSDEFCLSVIEERNKRKAIPRKLDAERVRVIRSEYASGSVTLKALAVKHNVSFSMVSRIVRGTAWRTAKCFDPGDEDKNRCK